MADVEALLNRSIATEGYVMPPSHYIDLSQIDLEALRKRFEKGRKSIEIQKLRTKIALKLAQMLQLNRTRMDFLEEFQSMIDEYNSESSNYETTLANLIAFARKLSEEDKRGVAEQLTEEELVIFDLLTKPDPILTDKETAEAKKVAKQLLEKLKREKLVLDWRKQQTTRAMVRITIEEILDGLPRAFSKTKVKVKTRSRGGPTASRWSAPSPSKRTRREGHALLIVRDEFRAGCSPAEPVSASPVSSE